MPRLLLVDENASIRRSAEILLGGTDLEMVAVESAEEALGHVAAGTVFDVALIHAFLPGSMDGWSLLAHLRQHPATARLPIALMAGVLKEVDPVQIAEAPIQGFLRKPIELGNLRERLATIMATPVPEPPPAPAPVFETVPGAPLDTLLPLPETRPEEAPMESDDDILMLEVEDLYPGEAVPVPHPEPMTEEALDLEAAGSDSLELEELDLEALRGLEPAAPPPFQAALDPWTDETPLETPPLPDLESTWEEVPALAGELALEATPEPPSAFLSEVEVSEGTVDLPDLGGDAGAEMDLGSELDLGAETPDWTPAEAFAPAALVAAAAAAPMLEAAPPPVAEIAPPSPIPIPPSPTVPPLAGAPSPEGQALVQALVSDPAAMDALCRAVVAELGDRALREIAWEILPELAKKLP